MLPPCDPKYLSAPVAARIIRKIALDGRPHFLFLLLPSFLIAHRYSLNSKVKRNVWDRAFQPPLLILLSWGDDVMKELIMIMHHHRAFASSLCFMPRLSLEGCHVLTDSMFFVARSSMQSGGGRDRFIFPRSMAFIRLGFTFSECSSPFLSELRYKRGRRCLNKGPCIRIKMI